MKCRVHLYPVFRVSVDIDGAMSREDYFKEADRLGDQLATNLGLDKGYFDSGMEYADEISCITLDFLEDTGELIESVDQPMHNMLTVPYNREQMMYQMEKNDYVGGYMTVDVDDLIKNDVGWLHDTISETMTGGLQLQDISWKVVSSKNDEIVLFVKGQIEEANL